MIALRRYAQMFAETALQLPFGNVQPVLHLGRRPSSTADLQHGFGKPLKFRAAYAPVEQAS